MPAHGTNRTGGDDPSGMSAHSFREDPRRQSFSGQEYSGQEYPGQHQATLRVATSQRSMSLASPDALVAAIPFLLGFVPDQSLVLVWLSGGQLQLTQRVDLPESSSADTRSYLQAVLAAADATVSDSLVACVFDEHWQSKGVLGHQRLMDGLRAEVVERGWTLLDALMVQVPDSSNQATRWWSYLCQQRCCPPEGRVVPVQVQTSVAAAFALEGVAVLSSRSELAASFAADSVAVARLAPRLEKRRLPAEPAARERWRTEHIRRLRQTLGLNLDADSGREQGLAATESSVPEQSLTDAQTIELVHALQDIRVRDCVLWSLAQAPDVRAVAPLFLQALRAAPEEYVPAVACCAAVSVWLTGDGARANMALQRALMADQHYSLAILLDLALRAALPPGRWVAMMAGLSEDDCRHGVEPEGSTGVRGRAHERVQEPGLGVQP